MFYPFSFKYLALILGMVALMACKNDLSTIQSLAMADTLPIEVAYDIELMYSDSAEVQAYLESPLMTRLESEDPVIEFPEGFKVIFYDSLHQPKSEITAKYGILYEKEKRMEARNNVIVKNIEKNEMLETEHLVWERKKGIIYSDVFIKITKPDQIIFGEGLKSDQNFESYEIDKPTGELNLYPDDDL